MDVRTLRSTEVTEVTSVDRLGSWMDRLEDYVDAQYGDLDGSYGSALVRGMLRDSYRAAWDLLPWTEA